MKGISAVLSRPTIPAERPPVAAAADSVPAASATGGGLGEPTPVFGVGFLLVWVTSGLVTALVVKRRGHDFRSSAALGFVFGPLFIPLAMQAMRDREDKRPILLSSGWDGRGPVDVLVTLLCDYQPSLVLVPGHPREALVAHAAEAGYDLLIIVGCSGRRLLPRRARAAGPSGHGGIPMLLVADAPRREQ